MSLFDKFKSIFPNNDYEDYEYDDYEEEETEQDYEDTYSYSEPEPKTPPRTEKKTERTGRTSQKSDTRNSKIYNMNTQAKPQVVITKPLSYDEARQIGDHLNMKRTVVLNLEETPEDDARRLFDFLSGAAYANSCGFKKIANRTFLITPSNVDVMGEALIGELESNGYYAY